MPTIKDVAREAGVSVGTVSRYLNGAVLKEQNQRRIDAAVARLGYRRNALARSMKTGRSMLWKHTDSACWWRIAGETRPGSGKRSRCCASAWRTGWC